MTTHGGRLPAETSRFFGRSVEYAAIADALGRSRLVTLTGPGGVGKTRLAVKVAAERARAFPDGVFLADLSAARDAAAVARTVAAALGLPGLPGRPDGPEDAGADGTGPDEAGPAGAGAGWLAGRLRGQRLLLILDTCEHLVDECAALAGAILRAGGPGLLVTSRQPLGLPAEVVFRIPPLAVDDALGLFADRAAAAVPGFAVTPVALPRLAQLCGLLDGIPLAIELAALRLRAVGLDELLARLPGRLRLLGSGRTGAGDRQQSLQASISWSYDLCGPSERLLWTRLPVFADTFDLVAAEHMCAGDGLAADEILGTLVGLVDKSVVLRAPDNGGAARYQLLGIVREHGAVMGNGGQIGNAVPRQARPPRSAGPGVGSRRPAGARGRGPAAGGAGGGELDDAASAGHWAMLTTREREVAALVALGLTSRDIAARLVVSKRTVDSHLEHILGKLGYNSRVQVAALASYELSRGQRDGQGRPPE